MVPLEDTLTGVPSARRSRILSIATLEGAHTSNLRSLATAYCIDDASSITGGDTYLLDELNYGSSFAYHDIQTAFDQDLCRNKNNIVIRVCYTCARRAVNEGQVRGAESSRHSSHL